MNDIIRDIEMGGARPVNGFFCPSEFWPALGYDGDARYVAIWWEPGGDEACYSDGRQMLIGADWTSYLTLIKHNFAARRDDEISLGTSEEPARNWLIIDRHTEHDAWFVPVAVADNILRGQWPKEERHNLGAVWSFEELLASFNNLPVLPLPSYEEIERQMQESHANYTALVAALEQQPGRQGKGPKQPEAAEY